MIGAMFVKFSRLIITKITKIVATRCQILRLKWTKLNFGWGSAQILLGSLPRPLAGFKRPTSKGRGKERREWRNGRGGVPSTFSCGSTLMRINAHADQRRMGHAGTCSDCGL